MSEENQYEIYVLQLCLICAMCVCVHLKMMQSKAEE
jgi:hypothetical protein